MKTEYKSDLIELISKMYVPSSPEKENSLALTLTEMHNQVTNILPEKWVDESDVYNSLKELGYKIYQQKIEYKSEDENGNSKVRYSFALKYFVQINN